MATGRGRSSRFAGFPADAIRFLGELEANNDRDWFRAHKDRYETGLREPLLALIAELGLGGARLFRPYRDTRFHPGPPISEHIAAGVGFERGAGYYVQLSLDGLLTGAGMHEPSREQLARYRAAVDNAPGARSLERAFASAAKQGLERARPALKRAPRGVDPDHPHIELLRLRSVTVSRLYPIAPWLHEREALDRVRSAMRASGPLVRWLREHVGPGDR